jgi:uncharacterized membrane protein
MIESLLGSHETKRIVVISALMFWNACLIAVRVERTGSGYYKFLIWNLFLACIPLVASTGLRVVRQLQFPLMLQAALLGLWLLFLPNAPYILTDLLHLRERPPVPPWYDLALLLSFAGTGVLLGYLSLVDIQELVARSAGRIIGWMVALSSLLLSGFAIYLGRFLGWNSWDPLVRPTILLEIAEGVLNPGAHRRILAIALIYGIILSFGYISLRLLLSPSSAPQRSQT